MKKLYNYLFYRSYDLLKLTGNYDLAWGASHFLAFNLMLLGFIILSFFKESMNFISLGIGGVSGFLIAHLINYFIFLKNDKYKIVIEYYHKESKQQQKIGRLVTIMVVAVLIYSLY